VAGTSGRASPDSGELPLRSRQPQKAVTHNNAERSKKDQSLVSRLQRAQYAVARIPQPRVATTASGRYTTAGRITGNAPADPSPHISPASCCGRGYACISRPYSLWSPRHSVTMPASPSVRVALICMHLHALATESGEKCRLGLRPPSFVKPDSMIRMPTHHLLDNGGTAALLPDRLHRIPADSRLEVFVEAPSKGGCVTPPIAGLVRLNWREKRQPVAAVGTALRDHRQNR